MGKTHFQWMLSTVKQIAERKRVSEWRVNKRLLKMNVTVVVFRLTFPFCCKLRLPSWFFSMLLSMSVTLAEAPERSIMEKIQVIIIACLLFSFERWVPLVKNVFVLKKSVCGNWAFIFWLWLVGSSSVFLWCFVIVMSLSFSRFRMRLLFYWFVFWTCLILILTFWVVRAFLSTITYTPFVFPYDLIPVDFWWLPWLYLGTVMN